MERQEIKEILSAMKSRKELLELMNSLKREELGTDATPFTAAQLSYFCNPNNQKRYKFFSIPKKSGGKRDISAPVSVLRSMLHYLNIILSSIYNPKYCVMGFTQGKSVADNARMHVRQNYVYNIDLSNFFPSIEQARVWKRLQVKPYNISRDIASAIAGLSSIKCEGANGDIKYVLPQGSPVSPILSNMICERLDYKLTKLAKDFGVNYSRYADDMTFSSMHNVYQEDGDFVSSLIRIIKEENFTINTAKTRLQKRGARQEVTGLNVTSHANVTKKYVNWIRTILHIWEKYGYQEAYSKFYPKYKAESGYKHKGEPDMVNVVSGKLLYMKMVKGEHDSTYNKLNDRFNILVEALGSTRPTENNLIYHLSYTVLSFEKKYSTSIEVKADNGNTFFGFFLTNKWQPISCANSIDPEKFHIYLKKLHNRKNGQRIKGRYYISLCSGKDSQYNRINRFWLVTKEKPKYLIGEVGYTIDALLEMFENEGVDEAMSMLEEPKQPQKVSKPSVKNHTPHAMVSALYKFSQHSIIKWFTHKPDSNSIDVNKLLNITTQALYGELLTGDRHEIINKSTWNNIKNFVLDNDNKERPLNAFSEPIPLAWGDGAVRCWCQTHSGEHPYNATIDGKPFKSSIIDFKHAIEFRTDREDMTFRMRVKEWIDKCIDDKELDVEYDDNFIEMEPVQIFTDVRLVFAAIAKIIDWIYDNKSKGNEIKVDVNNNDAFVELTITHLGSRLSMDGKKRDGLDGDFEEVRLMLLAVADLKIEADHIDGKSYSIVCLDTGFQAKNYTNTKETQAHMKTPCSWSEISDKVGGVKYFIKLYKNI